MNPLKTFAGRWVCLIAFCLISCIAFSAIGWHGYPGAFLCATNAICSLLRLPDGVKLDAAHRARRCYEQTRTEESWENYKQAVDKL